MMTDERLDQLIRSSLEWHADRAQAHQPTLRQATGRLAARLGPRTTQVRPRMTLAPATAGGINLLFVLVVLLLAAMAAVVVGALLLRDSRPPLPGPFGFAGACGVPLPDGYVMSFGIQDGFRQLHPGGSLHSDQTSAERADGAELTRTEFVEGTAFLERRLTRRGIELLQERISALQLTPGCARVQTRESSGAVFVRSEQGVAGLTWAPPDSVYTSAVPRRATVQEEARLESLASDLDELEAWLPAEAWIDSIERRIEPEQWLVQLTVTDRNRVTPAYTRIALPDGVEPALFGDELGHDPLQLDGAITSRCGAVSRSEALALAASIDLAGRPGWIGLGPAFPDGTDCQSIVAQTQGSDPPPDPTPYIDGEFADLHVCELVPREAAEEISGGPPELVPRRWVAVLDTWDPSCEIRDSTVMGTRASVAVHSRPMDLTAARQTALHLLGGSTSEEVWAGNPVWVNECVPSELGCWWYIAASSEPYFAIISADARSDLTSDDVRAFVEAVLSSIDR